MTADQQAALDKLNAAVQAETDVVTSVQTYIAGIKQQLADLAAGQADPAFAAGVSAASDLITADTDKLAQAIATTA